MPHVNAKRTTQQRSGPANQFVPESSWVRFSIKREAGNSLESAHCEKCDVGNSGYRVVPDIDVPALQLRILHHLPDHCLVPGTSPEEREARPGVVVPCKEPIHPDRD